MSSASAPVLTYRPEPSAPALVLPHGACDAHVHVFGPAARFPYAAERNFTPVDAPKETLFALHRRMGITRCVIVQSVVHGLDNSVVEDAIQAGEGHYLGVALVPVNVADSELRRLARAGFRGVRFNFMKHLPGAVDPEQLIALSARLRTTGMHLQVHFESSLVHSLAPVLARSKVPVMVDHMGRIDASEGIGGRDLAGLEAMLRAHPHLHLKVSGIDRIDAAGNASGRYEAGTAIARHLLEQFPDRCVWGTDWPHPSIQPIPDDGVLVNALARIAPTAESLQRVLVDNPAAFYRFDRGIDITAHAA